MFESLTSNILQNTQRIVETTLREQIAKEVVPLLTQNVSIAVTSQMGEAIRSELTEVSSAVRPQGK